MPTLTPEAIAALVKKHSESTYLMRARMQADYDLYRLRWVDSRQEAKADSYQTYISNEPRTYAKRMLAWLTAAKLVIRVPLGAQMEEQRARATAKEQFLIGALAEADIALLAQIQPPLREQLAFAVCIRGRYAGRALLTKDKDGSTHVDVTPFDPLHTFWGVGNGGLEWVVYRTQRTRAELESEYGVSEALGVNHGDAEITTYDYYSKTLNGVCTGSAWLKELTPHNSPRLPIFMGIVGATPPIVSWEGGSGTKIVEQVWEHEGESLYDEARITTDQLNKTMSDMMTLVRRSVKPPSTFTSLDGTKTTDVDPFVEGSQIPLRRGEEFKVLELLRMSLDTGPFLGQIIGELQRATIPHSSYGDLPFQLSGVALHTLRQALEGTIYPRSKAIENAYAQICGLLCVQYATGGFQDLTLSGRDQKKSFFTRTFQPEEIANAGRLEITLTPRLPVNDMERFTMAQIARAGDVPLLSDRLIRDDILLLQDVDAEQDAINEQKGEKASPIALLLTLIEALIKRGRLELAMVYKKDLDLLLAQRAAQETAMMSGLPMGGEEPPPAGQRPSPGNGGSAEMSQEIMARAAGGGMPAGPTGGPLVPPGTPRPGAQGQPGQG